MKMRAVLRIVLLALALSVVACDGGQQTSRPTPPLPSNTAEALVEQPTQSTTVQATPDGSGETEAAIDMSRVDACALITQAEAEAIMGPLEWNPSTVRPTVDEKRCSFVEATTHPDNSMEGNTIQVTVWPPEYWDMQLAVNGTGAPRVPGVGTEAFTVEVFQWQMLWAKVGQKAIVEVHVYPKEPELAKAIAQKVIEHLP